VSVNARICSSELLMRLNFTYLNFYILECDIPECGSFHSYSQNPKTCTYITYIFVVHHLRQLLPMKSNSVSSLLRLGIAVILKYDYKYFSLGIEFHVVNISSLLLQENRAIQN
jgi:hypothetical protein